MSAEECWECTEVFARNEMFDIPVFGHYTVKWCFDCANKQLKFSDKKIMELPKPKKSPKRVKTNCQSCGTEVEVLANRPYFGILCGECMKPKIYTSKN